MKSRNLKIGLVVIMSIFSFLFGCSKKDDNSSPDRFVSDHSFKSNLSKQIEMTPKTLEQLRTYGVADDVKLKLEIFFYTDTEDKARPLAGELRNLGYDVEAGLSAGDDRLFLVTGWTTPIQMDTISVTAWVEDMVRLGFAHDCEFDGWGTNPQQ